MSDHPNLQAALSAAAAGYPVFPVAPDSKRPLLAVDAEFKAAPWSEVVPDWLFEEGKGGFHQATLKPEFVRQYWSDFPNALPAVAVPPGRAVLDVDKPDAIEGHVLAKMSAAASCVVRTPGGGLHLHFAAVEGLDKQEALYADQPRPDDEANNVHLGDWKAASKGYTFAPGAVRADGGAYAIIHGTLDAPAGEFPPEYVPLLTEWYERSLVRWRPLKDGGERRPFGDPQFREGGPRRVNPDDLLSMGEGGRHDAMLRGTMQDWNEDVYRPLEWVAALVSAGRPEREAQQEVERAVRGAMATPRQPRMEPGKRILQDTPKVVNMDEHKAQAATYEQPDTCDSKRLSGFLKALKQIDCEIVQVMPSGHVGIIWPEGGDPVELEVRSREDARLCMMLAERVRDGAGGAFRISRADDRRMFYSEAARINPRSYEHLVDPARDAIEGVIRELPPGRAVVDFVLRRANVLNTTQAAAQSDFAKLAARIFREFGWKPTGIGVRSYLVFIKGKKILFSATDFSKATTGGRWENRGGQTRRRAWTSPAEWRPETGD